MLKSWTHAIQLCVKNYGSDIAQQKTQIMVCKTIA